MDYAELIQEIIERMPKDKNELQRIKSRFCKTHSLQKIPTDADILSHAEGELYSTLLPILRTKAMRTISGVAVVAVMTSPHPCPHGRCIYCPGGVENNSPQSYTGKEPASLRALENEFDPYLQVKARVEQLNMIGHDTDKIDLIVMGGTFTARNDNYQEWFIKRCFDALNDYEARNLEEAKSRNEMARHRCIGLTIETRPDYCREKDVNKILRFGATRVELGVQTTFDDVLENVERGHGVNDCIDATKILKDSGLKVGYHMMPGLPGSSIESDLESFRRIFEDKDFRPDMIKIYPTLIVKGTKLYELWRAGKYEPLTTEDGVKLIAEVKKIVPRWVRIQRVQRDIPANLIEAGIKKSNLRQLVREELERQREKCRCIRCREVGHKLLEGVKPDEESIKLERIDYDASGGREVFISFEDSKNEILIGYARLRVPHAHRKGIGSGSTIVREMKVLGQMVPISKKVKDEWQHRGFGAELVRECERISMEEFGAKRILVTSGVGAREYYRRFGYRQVGAYMGRELQ